MNSLSWLIYLADVVPAIGRFTIIITIVFFLATIVWGIAWKISLVENDEDSARWAKALRITPIIFLALSVVAIAVPTRQTIMMIAASEFGEEVATSSEAKNLGGKSYKALDKFLSDYLEESDESK